jgi:ceramide glucosyltransferase
MATRRDVLQRIGGFGILGDYCADDYVLGAAVYASGKEVVLSDHVIEHVVVNRSLRSSILHQVRWMKSTRFSRAWGHIGSVLTFAMPFGLLGAVAAIGLHRPRLALVFLITAWMNRVIMSLAAGWITVGDRRCFRYCWLYPVRDLMGFGFWCASFFGRRIVWRGESYRLEHGGLMVLCKAEGFSILAHAEDAGALASPVAVDNLS